MPVARYRNAGEAAPREQDVTLESAVQERTLLAT